MTTKRAPERTGSEPPPRSETATSWSTTRHPLNPEAGLTPMPTDPREIEAALRAGARTLRMVPYYGFRYGDRGVRFTRSDSAFLATLADEAPERADRQLVWLAGILASRGMPSLLLEMHLRTLAHELRRTVPEKGERYRRLIDASSRLGARRRTVMPDEMARRIVHDFLVDAGLLPTRLARGTGQLLVAAVADERNGVVSAVSSLVSFFESHALFPPRFVQAVRAAVDRARTAPSPARG